MKIDIQGTQLDLTPSVRQYAEEKIGTLERFLRRFEKEGERTVFVELARSTRHHKSGDVFYAEATLELPGTILRAEHKDEDIRSAIDRIRDILKNNIASYKNEATNRTQRRTRNK